ncbi:unnamed protein product [Closterium sp. NIES-65]|nr:unnamed protein product [Closterium sp. NIES-65]
MAIGPSYGVPAEHIYSTDWMLRLLKDHGLNSRGEEVNLAGGAGSGTDAGPDGAGSGEEGPAGGGAQGGDSGSGRVPWNEVPFDIRIRYEISVVKRARPNLDNKVVAAAITAKYGNETGMNFRSLDRISTFYDKWFGIVTAAVPDPNLLRMEEALAEWVIKEEEREKREVTREEIIAKAKEIGPGYNVRPGFRYGRSWATRFMKRFGLLLLSETSNEDADSEDGGGARGEGGAGEDGMEKGDEEEGEVEGWDGGLISFVNMQIRTAEWAAWQVLHKSAGGTAAGRSISSTGVGREGDEGGEGVGGGVVTTGAATPAMGVAPPATGAATPAMGVAPPATGAATPAMGVAPPATGAAPSTPTGISSPYLARAALPAWGVQIYSATISYIVRDRWWWMTIPRGKEQEMSRVPGKAWRNMGKKKKRKRRRKKKRVVGAGVGRWARLEEALGRWFEEMGAEELVCRGRIRERRLVLEEQGEDGGKDGGKAAQKRPFPVFLTLEMVSDMGRKLGPALGVSSNFNSREEDPYALDQWVDDPDVSSLMRAILGPDWLSKYHGGATGCGIYLDAAGASSAAPAAAAAAAATAGAAAGFSSPAAGFAMGGHGHGSGFVRGSLSSLASPLMHCMPLSAVPMVQQMQQNETTPTPGVRKRIHGPPLPVPLRRSFQMTTHQKRALCLVIHSVPNLSSLFLAKALLQAWGTPVFESMIRKIRQHGDWWMNIPRGKEEEFRVRGKRWDWKKKKYYAVEGGVDGRVQCHKQREGFSGKDGSWAAGLPAPRATGFSGSQAAGILGLRCPPGFPGSRAADPLAPRAGFPGAHAADPLAPRAPEFRGTRTAADPSCSSCSCHGFGGVAAEAARGSTGGFTAAPSLGNGLNRSPPMPGTRLSLVPKQLVSLPMQALLVPPRVASACQSVRWRQDQRGGGGGGEWMGGLPGGTGAFLTPLGTHLGTCMSGERGHLVVVSGGKEREEGEEQWDGEGKEEGKIEDLKYGVRGLGNEKRQGKKRRVVEEERVREERLGRKEMVREEMAREERVREKVRRRGDGWCGERNRGTGWRGMGARWAAVTGSGGGGDEDRGGGSRERGGSDGERGGSDGERGGSDGERGGSDGERGGSDGERGGIGRERGGR